MACSAAAERPRFDIADIVRQHRAALEAQEQLTVAQRRVLSAMELCRTAALGGHLEVCRSCGYEQPCYNSCRNRHCPKCQALAQEKWIAARSERLLPVQHFHVVFTLPSQLRALAAYRPRELFDALFAAASATLLELASSRLKARLGITMVLHTWTRDLRFHPHVHAIVTAGGLALNGSNWSPSSSCYLFPVRMMGALLRGKMMSQLRTLHRDAVFEDFDSFRDPAAFDHLMASLARKGWVVYAKKPFRKVDHVLAYLGRYTHRVAISNSRLIDVTEQAVTFHTKNGQTATLPPLVFLRRFLQHVLPARFHKIRHYGLYSSTLAQPAEALDRARTLLRTPLEDSSAPAPLHDATATESSHCPICGAPLVRIALPVETSRSPPDILAA